MPGHRFVTAKLPLDLVSELDEKAKQIERSKSWIVRQAVARWVAIERKRHELEAQARSDTDEGSASSGDEIERREEEGPTTPL